MAYDFIGLAHHLLRKVRSGLRLAPTLSGPPRAQLLGRPGYGDQPLKSASSSGN